jgi:hypothetical protein
VLQGKEELLLHGASGPFQLISLAHQAKGERVLAFNAVLALIKTGQVEPFIGKQGVREMQPSGPVG